MQTAVRPPQWAPWSTSPVCAGRYRSPCSRTDAPSHRMFAWSTPRRYQVGTTTGRMPRFTPTSKPSSSTRYARAVYEFAGTAAWPIARLDLMRAKLVYPGWKACRCGPPSACTVRSASDGRRTCLPRSPFSEEMWPATSSGAWQHSENAGYAHTPIAQCGHEAVVLGKIGGRVVNQTALTDDGSLRRDPMWCYGNAA
jgi:hypothetical protein